MVTTGSGARRLSETSCPSGQLRPALFQILDVVLLVSASTKANVVPSTTSVSCAAPSARAVSNAIPKLPVFVLIAIVSKA